MWYLTILYLYVNINTCCCITNGIKKGWPKCWMSENSACVERVPQGAAALQEHARDWSWLFPGRTWSRSKAPQWHPLLLLCASAGNPHTLCDIPGTHSHFCCSPLCSSLCRNCALHKLWREQKLYLAASLQQGVSWWGSSHLCSLHPVPDLCSQQRHRSSFILTSLG